MKTFERSQFQKLMNANLLSNYSEHHENQQINGTSFKSKNIVSFEDICNLINSKNLWKVAFANKIAVTFMTKLALTKETIYFYTCKILLFLAAIN